jgi:hypothetical protein
MIARTARGRRHGFDRASVREPLATLAHDAHHHVPRICTSSSAAGVSRRQRWAMRSKAPPRWHLVPPATAPELRRGRTSRCCTATKPRRQALARSALARSDSSTSTVRASRRLLFWGSAQEEARSRRLADGRRERDRAVVAVDARRRDAPCARGARRGRRHGLHASRGGARHADDRALLRDRPAVHGVACAGPHARDSGDGRDAGADEVIAPRRRLRAAPRC